MTELTAIKAAIDSAASPSLQAVPLVNVRNNIHASINDTVEVIRYYKNDPERRSNLPLLSKLFDPNRGMFRAVSYIALLEESKSELGRAIIISAILKGGGTELKDIVTHAFGTNDTLKIQGDLMNLIHTSLKGKFLQSTVRNVIDSIIKTADSNKAAEPTNFTEELAAIHALEKLEQPPSPRSPASR